MSKTYVAEIKQTGKTFKIQKALEIQRVNQHDPKMRRVSARSLSRALNTGTIVIK